MAEVFRRIKNNNYTVMCNHHLQNEHLSLKAMGLMSKLLSLPDDWNYSVRGIAAICKDGYESVRTAFLELEKEGYIVRRRIRDQQGHIIRTEYYILETPDTVIPEESEGAKETLPASAEMEASKEKEMADQQEKERNLPLIRQDRVFRLWRKIWKEIHQDRIFQPREIQPWNRQDRVFQPRKIATNKILF